MARASAPHNCPASHAPPPPTRTPPSPPPPPPTRMPGTFPPWGAMAAPKRPLPRPSPWLPKHRPPPRPWKHLERAPPAPSSTPNRRRPFAKCAPRSSRLDPAPPPLLPPPSLARPRTRPRTRPLWTTWRRRRPRPSLPGRPPSPPSRPWRRPTETPRPTALPRRPLVSLRVNLLRRRRRPWRRRPGCGLGEWQGPGRTGLAASSISSPRCGSSNRCQRMKSDSTTMKA
mmetsp:Transcript_9506/g.21593  ORF Transcript_9506/g.21593 Transcript_9506/m.21593 type:complete len:228 (+) Transcript_9506:287-970(+)